MPKPEYVVTITSPRGILGPYKTRGKAERTAAKLTGFGYKGVTVAEHFSSASEV